jgi:DNA-nicking Smr family endonuclease
VNRRGPRDRKPESPSFGDAVGPVKPLAPRTRRVPPPTRVTVPSSRPQEAVPPFELSGDELRFAGARIGSKRLLAELATGRHPIFETVDLHGLTLEESERELASTFRRVRGRHRRVVLVIHGKGTHTPGGRGVLRDQISHLLSSPPLAHYVTAFVSALPRDGGTGAVYVLLAPWSFE